MNAYIISIGDEILIGQTINSNAGFIGEKLSEISINVTKISAIGDDDEAIINELKIAEQSNDLIIVTGGLGPTHDDVTRKSIVKYFETKLISNDQVLDDIKKLFAKRGRKLTKVNEEQALVPELATVIRNQVGTAPGLWIKAREKYFVILPGVPAEMKSMMNDFVIPGLKEILGQGQYIVRRKILQTTGIPESLLYEKFGDIDEFLDGAKFAFLPNEFGVKIRLTVEESDEKLAKEKISEIEQKVRTKVGRFIYGTNDDSLEEVVGKLLIDRGLTVSVAESCTGGLLANMITNVSGSSKYFERGVVCYSNASKVEILKVDEDTLTDNGAVSREVAMQMADGIRSTSGSSIGIATTGIMGPTGATTDKPVGLVYIGYCDEKLCTAKKIIFGEDRILNKNRTAQAALDFLRRQLLGISTDD